ncbi:MAG: VOC family protein [Promethearchaeota archaeon]|jgi:catechol 2,3-dioxygenase-like lactoylglutathione lyase family enzyme
MVVNLSPLTHIEISVNDAEAAFQVLNKNLGAIKVQEELAALLGGEGAIDIHVGLGDVVFQFVQPKIHVGSWSDQLKNSGPGVHNITFGVDDMQKTRDIFKNKGISELIVMDFEWDKIIPAEALKPNPQPVVIMNTMDILGFHLELYQPFLKEGFEPLQQKYVTGHDNLIGDVSPMLHIELVTPDIEKTYQFLHDVFGSEKVEVNFAEFLDGEYAKVAHINLSNVVLQYIQPLVQMGPWYELLQKVGPAVHNITFLVNNIEKTIDLFKNNGISPVISFPLEWENLVGKDDFNPNSRNVHIFNTMEKLGFHLELFERPSIKSTEYVFTEVKEWWDKKE